jgi:hypothetical protein
MRDAGHRQRRREHAGDDRGGQAAASGCDFHRATLTERPSRVQKAERRRNRTYPPWGCHGVPVLKARRASRDSWLLQDVS